MKRKEILVLFMVLLIIILITGCIPLPPLLPPSPLPPEYRRPDLEVVDISCVSPEGILSFTIENVGIASMPNDWRTGPEVVVKITSYYAEFDIDFPLGQVALNEPAVSSSNGGIDQPGGTSTYNTDIVIGDFYTTVKVVVDYSDQIPELSEGNNTKLQVYVPCGRGILPDLVVEELWILFPAELIPGDDLDNLISIGIKNLGKQFAYGTESYPNQGYIIDFVLSSDENIPDNPTVFEYNGQVFSISLPISYLYYQEDMLVGRISLTEDVAGDGEVGYWLARYLGGEVINLPREFPTVEWGWNPKRTFYLYAIIDPLYKVEEAMDDNNIFHIPVYIERPLNY